VLIACITEEERTQNNITLILKEFEKEELIKHKVIKQKEITKITVEIFYRKITKTQ
jgi:hypothetical protein